MKNLFILKGLRYLLLNIVLALLIIACNSNKDKDDTPAPADGVGYVRFKLDGVQQEYKATTADPLMSWGMFNSITNEPSSPSGKSYGAFLIGRKGKESTINTVSWTLLMYEPIKTNVTYTNYTSNTKTKAVSLIVGFNDKDANTNISGMEAISTTVADAEVIITEVNAKVMKGTFSSTIYQSKSGVLGQKTSLTEGEFYAVLQ